MNIVVFLNQMSLKFVPNGLIYSKPALVQILVRHRTGNKQLFEPIVG